MTKPNQPPRLPDSPEELAAAATQAERLVAAMGDHGPISTWDVDANPEKLRDPNPGRDDEGSQTDQSQPND